LRAAPYPPRSSEVLPKIWKNSGKIIAKRMQSEIKHLYVFGPFRFDPDERLLLRDGTPVPLSPKLTETLLLLVQNAGHLVGKDELMKGLWPDAFVEEGNLNKNIFVLRKTLGQWDGGLEYIETVSKRGYRFVAPVDRVAKTETGPQVQPASALNANEGISARTTPRMWARLAMGAPLLLALIVVAALQMNWRRREPAATSFTPAIHSVAVLPLEDLSGDPSENYFADGMTDELITRLGQLTSLRVISRTSTMQYRGVHKPLPQIAHELNVDAIVEGTVVRSGGKVRITAQLIQAPADKHLWAQSYEGDVRDVLALQNQVAQEIAKQVRSTLIPHEEIRAGVERPLNLKAYESYLRGEHFLNRFTPDSVRAAGNYFQNAIDEDPGYSPAYTKLAGSYQILAAMGAIPKDIAHSKAKLLVAKALQIDPQFGPAHAVRGWSLLLYDLDFAAAGAEFKRAVELSPNSVEAHEGLGNYYVSMGQVKDSVQEVQYARKLDPLGLIVNRDLCRTLYFARRFDEALAQCKANLDLNPNSVSSLLYIGNVYGAKGMDSEATSTYIRALELADAPVAMIAAVKKGAGDSGLTGYWRAVASFVPENLSNGKIESWEAAIVYTNAGDNDKALMWLEKAIEARCYGITYLGVDPEFDGLRPDSRFLLLLHRIGLPTAQS
jgi:TolB-like protein/DNA-binding winged helix-turn-helix (wHTH) protein